MSIIRILKPYMLLKSKHVVSVYKNQNIQHACMNSSLTGNCKDVIKSDIANKEISSK